MRRGKEENKLIKNSPFPLLFQDLVACGLWCILVVSWSKDIQFNSWSKDIQVSSNTIYPKMTFCV